MVERTSFIFGIARYIAQTYGVERTYLCGMGIECGPRNVADWEEEDAYMSERCESISIHG